MSSRSGRHRALACASESLLCSDPGSSLVSSCLWHRSPTSSFRSSASGPSSLLPPPPCPASSLVLQRPQGQGTGRAWVLFVFIGAAAALGSDPAVKGPTPHSTLELTTPPSHLSRLLPSQGGKGQAGAEGLSGLYKVAPGVSVRAPDSWDHSVWRLWIPVGDRSCTTVLC